MKKAISCMLTLCLVLLLTTPALASQGTKNVSITYRGISLTLDDQPVVPVDAEGRSVEPFILDGTTYLPVRGVANALSLDVAWDGTTNTVTLTSGGSSVTPVEAAKATHGTVSTSITYRDITIILDGASLSPADAAGNPVEPFLLDGTTYLPVRAISEALNLTVTWDDATSTVILTSAGHTPALPPADETSDGNAAPAPGDSTETASGSTSSQGDNASVQTSGVYVGSIDSDKFHYPSCRFAEKILPENEIWFDTREEAYAAGYVPCGVCKP